MIPCVRRSGSVIVLGWLLCGSGFCQVIEPEMVHLRSTDDREWSEFPQQPDAASLKREFTAKENVIPYTLSLRQQDVKQSWQIRINDKVIGRLVSHEADLITDVVIGPKTLVDGSNQLEIIQTGKKDGDDIRVGEIEVLSLPPLDLRYQSHVLVDIQDENQRLVPGRVTLVDQRGVLMPVSIDPNHYMAAREGVIYTATGKARFGVAPGKYRLFAGRGFEFGVDAAEVDVQAGQQVKRTLTIRREVDTTGWVACDTHIHTLTHSGHGDASVDERIVTLAGEGVELPIATDHNKHIDYRPILAESKMKDTGVERFFTPVIGNEVTTKVGHFNVFPVASSDVEIPEFKSDQWTQLFDDIYSTPDVRVAILNHARDIHGGFRPFSPRHHVSLSGQNLDGWDLRANAMEIINSGATQSDPLELFRDWCGLINRGIEITPVGCSDSHDVARYIGGQGRTYIRCDDHDPANIDVQQAVDAFLAGRVIVSYGLMADVIVNDEFGPGDLVPVEAKRSVSVQATIRGPEWTDADSVQLYVNGQLVDQSALDSATRAEGVIGEATFSIDPRRLPHDGWVTVVALGDGIRAPYWAMAKPYQPDSPDFHPVAFSCSGPIRLDVDGDGRFSSANTYAKKIVESCNDDLPSLGQQLAKHDPSVAIQVLAKLQNAANDAEADSQPSLDVGSNDFAKMISQLPAPIRDAVNRYRRDRRDSEIARVEARE
ncbi:MAG: CehA/McbA family metallohydrolase [Pirellulaceae bacterium]|nr:CehA/McbA family metallohydrolase [Pirellulaceae bacterium]